LRNYIYIAILLGTIFALDDLKKTGLSYSLSMSNIGYYMIDFSKFDDEGYSQFYPGFSLGYFREDIDGIQSGFGLHYTFGVHPDYLEESSSKKQALYGVGIYSFVDRELSFIRLGLKSYYDFGNSDYNFIMGPTAGFQFEAVGVNFNINYFRGCTDFVNFARFTDYVELAIALPFKGKKN